MRFNFRPGRFFHSVEPPMAVGVLLHKIMMKENSLNRITIILVT